MPNVKISSMPDATTPLGGSELAEIVQGGVNKKVAVKEFGRRILTIQEAGTTLNTDSAHWDQVIESTNSGGLTVTVRTFANSGLDIGACVYFLQGSTGQITLVAAGGVTLETPDSLKTRGQECIIGIKHVSLNKWQVFGDLETVLAGVSVLGRSANSSGVMAAITAGSDGHYLKRSGGALLFGAIAQADVTNLVADLALKAPLASPALTGVPTAPTAAVTTDTAQIATTAYVRDQFYKHTQGSANVLWTINHNLGREVEATAFTTGGVRIIAEVTNVSANQVTIAFETAQAGYAVIS